eukprot:maker-scaffold1877_size25834-snap-gene-0.9 protein:Tk00097 transcript:maker-scaffold1877_size25834-snap-gene-0.9-mRNA-1 annotation:"ras and ef-hand domain-containing protein"
MSNHFKLEQLFNQCDTLGTGFIDQKEFRDLCRGFEIDNNDADIIFFDLDHDGDGKISFDDFAFGFRDFVTPGSRRGSIQLGLESPGPSKKIQALEDVQENGYAVGLGEEAKQKQMLMERKHSDAQAAWRNFADHLGKEDVKKFLSVSTDKIFTLYEQLQSNDTPPHLMMQFEEVIAALMADVKNMESETKKMEEKMSKERESHTAHLKTIEAELDAQVARVENAAREKARRDYESEKKELQEKMEVEMTQLEAQLKIFQKIDSYLTTETIEANSKEAQKKLETACSENRTLKNNLSDTKTNIAVLRAEMNKIRSQYDAKCYELHEERETKAEFLYEFDNLSRQLDLLRDANQQLQDTNDGLRSVVDVSYINSLNSPRPSSRNDLSGFFNSDLFKNPSDPDFTDRISQPVKRRKRRVHHPGLAGSRSPSDRGSVYDSDSMRSKCSTESGRPRLSDVQFGIRRLMDDLDDSGHSTLPNDDLEYETREALLELESATGEEDLSPGETPRGSMRRERRFEQDRDVSEVSAAEEMRDAQESESVADQSMTERQVTRKQSDPRPAAPGALGNPSTAVTLRDLEPTGPPDRTYKVVFAGDAAVGKTSFINRLTKGVFLSNLSSTLGVDFQVKTIRVDERNIAIQLWDTAGQERFRSVTRSYFRRADGVMLLYDVTSDRSFMSVRQWIDAVDVRFKLNPLCLSAYVINGRQYTWLLALFVLQDVSEKRIPIMLCANKIDLRPEVSASGRRCVTTAEGERMGRDHSAIFIETSAKDGNNVIDALVQLSRDMCASEDVEVQTSALKIRDDGGKKKSCCR